MPSKKQSVRPAEAGWLLEVGVIGIDKTLKLILLSKWTLVELELFFRQMSLKSVLGETTRPERKKALPWLKIDTKPGQMEGELISHPIEGQEDYQRCIERLIKCLVSDEESKRKKGRGPTSDRQPLHRWLMDAETLDLIVKGPEGVEVLSKRLKKIKAYCLVLADAVKVICGERKSMPTGYPSEVKRWVSRQDLGKVREIIKLSLSIPKQRDEALVLAINKTEKRIRERESELMSLRLQSMHLRQIESLRKKVGRGNPKA
jgi:hypothetical protein